MLFNYPLNGYYNNKRKKLCQLTIITENFKSIRPILKSKKSNFLELNLIFNIKHITNNLK